MTTTRRVLAGRPASFSVTLLDQWGEPASATGVVSATVSNVAGDTITVGDVTNDDQGTYSFTTTAALPAKPDILTVTLTDAGTGTSQVELIEVAGAYYFSNWEAREVDDSLQNTTKYPSDALARVRIEVEDEFENIVGFSFVPRVNRAVISGNGGDCLFLDAQYIRSVRALKVDGVALTSDELLALDVSDGVISRPSGYFAAGNGNLEIAYEHGWDTPPSDVKRAAITRLRERWNQARSAFPERATSFTAEGGGVFALATPGKDWSPTGNPDIDAILLRYRSTVPVVV